MTFNEWAKHHATIFGLVTEQEVQMLMSWRSMFEADGVTVQDLFAVSNWLASHKPPTFRTQHLNAIQERLKSWRIERMLTDKAAEIEAAETDRGVCLTCNNSGLAIVPHPESIHAGQWVGHCYSFAVICNCIRGRSVLAIDMLRQSEADEKAAEKRLKAKKVTRITIEEYERSYPDWRIIVASRQKSNEEKRVAADRAGTLDKQLGEIVRRAKQGVTIQ